MPCNLASHYLTTSDSPCLCDLEYLLYTSPADKDLFLVWLEQALHRGDNILYRLVDYSVYLYFYVFFGRKLLRALVYLDIETHDYSVRNHCQHYVRFIYIADVGMHYQYLNILGI